MVSPAFRTQTFYHIVDACQTVALGQRDGGDGGVVQTEGAVAALAVEVYVLVVVLGVAVVAVAQLVAHAVAAVLDDVYQMVLAEQRQHPEYARLVYRQDLVFQLR